LGALEISQVSVWDIGSVLGNFEVRKKPRVWSTRLIVAKGMFDRSCWSPECCMSFELFNTNADIGIKMAAGTRSNEVHDQWKELAAQWRSKAHACKSSAPAARSQNIKHLDVSPATSPELPVHRPHAKCAEARGSKATHAEVRLLPSALRFYSSHTTIRRHWTQFGRRSSQKS
jgi:hypothetical protein